MNIKPWLHRLYAIALAIVLSLTVFNLPAAAYSDADVATLESSNKCEGCDLSNYDFTQANFSLYGSYLVNSDLSGANLHKQLLNGADLTSVNLTNADLSEAIAMGAKFESADLTSADLTQAHFDNARMDQAIMEKSNLTGIILTYAKLKGAYMANIQGMNAKFKSNRCQFKRG